MKLSKLLEKVKYDLISGSVDIEIDDIITDSRKDVNNCVFVCIKGAISDSHKFACDVVDKGALAIITEQDLNFDYNGVTIVKVDDTKLALALMSCAYFDYPADKITTIGITGTKGKTTSSYMIRNILESCNIKTGLIGTIEIIIGKEHIKSVNTTPGSYDIQKYLRKMLDIGINTVVMEVSSQALMLHRTSGIIFDIAVFTNLAKDHIGPNEHNSFEHYLKCKSLLFKSCQKAVVNNDDKYVNQILSDSKCDVITYGVKNKSDYTATNIKLIKDNSYMGVSFDVNNSISVDCNVPGEFSVYNALCALTICKILDVSDDSIIKALQDIKVKGRVEMINTGSNYVLMIDYAHNAMALQSLLLTIKEYNPKRIVTLFGCGGDRSKDRRFEMGEVSGNLSDLTIITSDNPRTEDPNLIIDDIIVGISKTNGKYIRIPDRIEAIKYAIDNALEGDVIILAGKGHEDYQEINGVKYDMDERVIVKDILNSNI